MKIKKWKSGVFKNIKNYNVFRKKQHFKLHLIFISFTFKVMKLFVFQF